VVFSNTIIVNLNLQKHFRNTVNLGYNEQIKIIGRLTWLDPGADSINISGLLNPKKLGKLKKLNTIKNLVA